jgi:predicted transcriptional regulator
MKFISLLITLLFSATGSVFSQDMDSAVAHLLKSGLIEKSHKKNVKDILQQLHEVTASSMLVALTQVEVIKRLGGNYKGGMVFFDEPEKPDEKKQQKINSDLEKYLEKLNSAGLLTPALYSTFRENIRQNKYADRITFIHELTNEAAYAEWLKPEKLLDYAGALRQNEILTDGSYGELITDINKNKIRSEFQLIRYCRHAASFDLPAYSNEPSVYLEQIHREVSQLLPELKFTDFSWKIEADSMPAITDYVSHDVIVSFKCNGKTYTHKSFISPYDVGKDGNYLGKIDERNFYKIFNKVLADVQSAYRLHHIGIILYPTSAPTSDNSRFGIIALKKEQAKMLPSMGPHSYLRTSYEQFQNSLTSKRIEEAVAEWRKTGILNHLNDEQVKLGLSKALQASYNNLNDVLLHFPDVIFSFDLELGNPEDPYAELLREFSKISHGAFKPQNISDSYSQVFDNKLSVSFTLNGKTYSKTLKLQGDWIDADFFDLVVEAVTDSRLEGQFYNIYESGQGANIIFLTEEQHRYLKANKLLVFDHIPEE